MARTNINLMENNIRFYRGISTDIKPTENVGSGSKYYERDTGKDWIYDVDTGWVVVTQAE